MTRIHHINAGRIRARGFPDASCHCLLLEDANGLALVDAGIGLNDVRDPDGRIGRELIEMAGFVFNEPETAVRQIERLGFSPDSIKHILLTHADPDHAGGLADFPQASIHLSSEEYAALTAGNPRYLPIQFAHQPHWQIHAPSSPTWFGLEARPVQLGFESEVLLIPLFGHTRGQCGVAIQQGNRWDLHVGDAYYLRVELERDDHPVSQLAQLRADNNEQRLQNLEQLRRLHRDHADEITLYGYHDPEEVPGGIG
jgi:glyoxylase-like metal-dependent hydrolase (beta-lactamase superfamily II)